MFLTMREESTEVTSFHLMFHFLSLLSFAAKFVNDKEMRIWFDKPSSKLPLRGNFDQNIDNSPNAHNVWEQNTLPIGNGDMGANIYGEITEEHITFNEKTLWTGGPSESRPNYIGGNIEENGRNGTTLKEIQDLFESGKSEEASKKCEKLLGNQVGMGNYQFFTDIFLTFNTNEGETTEYVRYLDLDKGISEVHYLVDGTKYHREYFISHPHNVFVIHLYKEGSRNLSVEIKPNPAHKCNLTIDKSSLICQVSWKTISFFSTGA